MAILGTNKSSESRKWWGLKILPQKEEMLKVKAQTVPKEQEDVRT